MFDELEDSLAELLLRNGQHSAQDIFLAYLVMEPFIKQFRSQGLSNRKILEFCRNVDESRDNE